MVKGDFAPGFMIDLMVKDLRILEQSIKETGLDLPGSVVVKELFERLQKQGHGHDGTQALFLAVNK
jgi:3-hydroxyisobutyrate dehydrogenase-like beta-hydroxyacid dehydrogenase